ncbi:hypothetical protein [Filimonas effusa]|uniref:Uncharacterized protein n=1 Tax=Filimonas effusa TaxID=2508721 RepID=A0A4Q1DB04_9BACT|nr:hypothetical protein [Filimonas effusa]RXK86088.1 hypothetical protein ESB13_04560 [Filimonas effusa]
MTTLREALLELGKKTTPTTILADEGSSLVDFVNDDALGGFELTFAERILLSEGSMLGKADCTIPPYVEYENLVDFSIKPNYIRSEIMEWALGISISKILFRSGTLNIIGADFITNGDIANVNYRTSKVDGLFESNDRFSLNLSSREITLDLHFKYCNFLSGINISNSYCENLLFTSCRFGCANESDSSDGNYSIYAVNTVLKGDFKIDNHPNISKGIQAKMERGKKWLIINSTVDFSHARIDGQFLIGGINDLAQRDQFIVVNGNLDLYSFSGNSINLSGATIAGTIMLSLARFNFLWGGACTADHIVGNGLECSTLYLNGGCFFPKGVVFGKSVVHGDLFLGGSYYGKNDDELKGGSINVSGSRIGRLYLDERMIALGRVDLAHTTIEDSIFFDNAHILGLEKNNKRKAIDAAYIRVKNRISFSPARDIGTYGQQTNYLSSIKSIFNRSLEIDTYTDAAGLHTELDQFGRLEHDIFFPAFSNIENFFPEVDEKHAKIFGEANFEHAIIGGAMDCSGGAFKNPGGDVGDANLPNALNLRFSEISDSLFINRGIGEKKDPFIAEGDIDLQNATINNLFISVPKKGKRNRSVRLNLIGTKYNYVESDCGSSRDFYAAKWIYYRRRSWFGFRKSSNFRQPFEQFSSALFKSGEDNRARDVLIYHRPSANILEYILMFFVRLIYFMGSRIYLCVCFLIFFILVGKFVFGEMLNRHFIIEQGAPDNKVDPLVFSLHRIFPLVDIIDKDAYSISHNCSGYFIVYYVLHSVIGLILLSMLLVNIARMRKGDN